jgi:hypothetical protein
MNRKTYKLFGIVILEIETDQDAVTNIKEKDRGNGSILSLTDRDKLNYKNNGDFEERV